MTKSHTTPYHPMVDSLVERMNLNLLHAFAQKYSDWEDHLQLLMFVYTTLPSTHLQGCLCMKSSLVATHHLKLQSWIPKNTGTTCVRNYWTSESLSMLTLCNRTTATSLPWQGTIQVEGGAESASKQPD